MQATRDRQKSYADLKHKPMEFQVGDKVMLKVSPWKGFVHFGKRRKLNPRYVGPFKVLERIGDVAYKLDLPKELSRVHNTFHVSNLKKCHADEPLAVPLDELHFDDKLHFVEEPVEIMDREVKWLKKSRIPLVKVRWNSKRGRKAYFLDDKQIPSVKVFSIWKAFGGNTRDLRSFGEEMDKTTDLNKHFSRLCFQRLETASQDTRDIVIIHPMTVSHESMMASARTTQPKI
nr:putative reverse transcriptase domain-containing protein [Tanacetum cinerariifolium]